MTDDPPLELSRAEADTLTDFLAKTSISTRDKAEMLADTGRVSPVHRIPGTDALVARVSYYRDYDVTLTFRGRSRLTALCWCPGPHPCCHSAAVARCALAIARVVETPVKGTGTGPAPERKPEAGGVLGKALVEALGRPLTPRERKYAARFESIHRKTLRTRRLDGRDLLQLADRQDPFGLGRFAYLEEHLLDEPFESVLDFCLYLLDGRCEVDMRLPEWIGRLAATVKPGPALLGYWNRREVREWTRTIADDETRLRGFEAATIRQAPPVREVRVVVGPGTASVQSREDANAPWKRVADNKVADLFHDYLFGLWKVPPGIELPWAAIVAAWQSTRASGAGLFESRPSMDDMLVLVSAIARFPRDPACLDLVHSIAGGALLRPVEPLRWVLSEPSTAGEPYQIAAMPPDGSPIEGEVFVVLGRTDLVLTPTALWHAPHQPGRLRYDRPNPVPASVIESGPGIRMLRGLGIPIPERLRSVVRTVPLRVVLEGAIIRTGRGASGDAVCLTGRAVDPEGRRIELLRDRGWQPSDFFEADPAAPVDFDRSALGPAAEHLGALGVRWDMYCSGWTARVTPDFPGRFAEWIRTLPPGIELVLSPELDSLRRDPVAGSVSLACTPVGIDWFDLTLTVDAGGETFTDEEARLLLAARGGWTRLEGRGWRRLEWSLGEEDERRLARLGLDARDLDPGPQRIHALQLADEAVDRFLAAEQADLIRRRAAEIQARVSPAVPAGLRATLRPYQVEGFHFLAYLAENSFGGVLADDMGLGKTLQTLAWIAWLRDRGGEGAGCPVLIVCPKSVAPNWKSEAGRFLPGLRVTVWGDGGGGDFATAAAACDAMVVNYAQLRILAREIVAVGWLAVIADEAQAVKNPDSQTARVLRGLRATHRLALTGTPIENRLLDLWSLMAFVMPGALGPRAEFERRFGRTADALARQRLASRLRPFLLRRTKAQVADDLPPRIEEDLHCDMEGVQASLYRAEFKHARAMLGRIRTSSELDAMRFHFLTSLLRLRQICCHPALVDPGHAGEKSAKLEALVDLLEPLMAEGHKVLVFSQFVGMLDILRRTVRDRGWKDFLLTGSTEDRGPLVDGFNRHDGPAVFLISLKAGGSGLNLASASYVVLFDPWWNPAVEAQAIDRTHRIGQRNTVIAYRLLVKDSIEDKIRTLQKQKRLLADDVLGEERFAQSLTLDDLRVLFDAPDPGR